MIDIFQTFKAASQASLRGGQNREVEAEAEPDYPSGDSEKD